MVFDDKTVIITGATGGIGAEAARNFARLGANLCLVDLDMAKLEELKTELKVAEEKIILNECDVRDEEKVKVYVDGAVDKFKSIDIFINNAGVEGEVVPITMTESDKLDFVLDVNVKGAYYGLKYVLPVMYEQKSGSVINVASVAGFIGSPGLAPYIASKHALLGINKTAALESAAYNVRVNAVCPGPVDNNMMRNIEKKASPDAPEAVKEGFLATLPMGRYASNEDVVNTILFLASDLSSYLTGTAHRVDGGMGAK